MNDFHAINEAINQRAGRKLLPSIAVSASIIGLVWFALAYHRELFAVLIGVAVILGIREITKAFGAAETYLSLPALIIATVVLTAATWRGSAGIFKSREVPATTRCRGYVWESRITATGAERG